MSRVIAALGVLSLALACYPGETSKPNILWLIAEDVGPELSCYGTPQVFSPNVDKLAERGMRFTRAYTTAPVCSPSRSAFMTGMYQTAIGAHQHRSHRDDGYKLPDGVKVITDWIRPAGYFTANVISFPKEADLRGTGKTDWNFQYDGQPFDGDDWSELKGKQPFFAQVNFSETHRTGAKDPTYFGVKEKRADPEKVAVPPYYPDHPLVRQDWANYCDAATQLDGKIGRVLKQLVADGLAENTIIFFFGDNGQAHVRGKQWCYESGLHVPLIVYVPEKFMALKNYQPKTVSDRLVDMIDVSATTVALTGAQKPPKMNGRVLFGEQSEQAREYSYGARDRCDETAFRFRSVRDARYRYIRNFTADRPFLSPNKYKEHSYPVWNLIKELHAAGKLNAEQAALGAPTMPPEELFDLQADPHEIKNLAASTDPEHQAAHQRLRAELDRWITETNDHGATLESAELVQAQGMTRPETQPSSGYRWSKAEGIIVSKKQPAKK